MVARDRSSSLQFGTVETELLGYGYVPIGARVVDLHFCLRSQTKREAILDIELNGVGKISECSLVVVLIQKSPTAGAISVAGPGIESNGFRKISDGLIVVTFISKSETAT